MPQDMHGNPIRLSQPVVQGEVQTANAAQTPIVDEVELASVAVVVCVHNRPDVAIPCLLSFDKHTPASVRLIVVDDASDDYTAQRLDDVTTTIGQRRPVDVVRFNENQRYTRSINYGFSVAFAHTSWAVALNSDTLVTPFWLERMLAASKSRPRVGIVCPYMSNAALLTLPIAPGTNYLAQAERLAAVSKRQRPDAVTPVGACMMVHRDLWAECGPFDISRYPEGYGEECELWARAVASTPADLAKASRQPGSEPWDAVVADDAYVLHESHASFGQQAQARERQGVETFKSYWGELLNRRFVAAQRNNPLPSLQSAVQLTRVSGSARPRLAFYIHGIVLCGGVLALVNICNGLIEKGIDATIVYARDDFGDLGRMPMHFAPIRVPEGSVPPQNWLETTGLDNGILLATAWGTGEFVQRLGTRFRNLKVGAFVQDLESSFRLPNGRLQFVRRAEIDPYLGLVAKRAVVNSSWVREAMTSEYGVTPEFYIPIGVDTDLFYPPFRRPEGKIRLLSFSRPSTPRRGYKLLAGVYRELARRHKNIEFITYDQAPGPDVPSIHMGKLPQRQLADLMRSCHILVEPSVSQGWGMPAQEFMATGGCVVSTDNGGIHNYGRHKENCLIGSPDSVNEIVELVEQAIDNRSLRERLGQQARKDMEQLSWSRVVEAWEKVVRTWLSA